MLTSWDRYVDQYRFASGSDLQRPDLVATVMEHAPTVYCDLVKVVLLQHHWNYQTLRADERARSLAQRGHDDFGRLAEPDTSSTSRHRTYNGPCRGPAEGFKDPVCAQRSPPYDDFTFWSSSSSSSSASSPSSPSSSSRSLCSSSHRGHLRPYARSASERRCSPRPGVQSWVCQRIGFRGT